jgi:Family of unknown function (DUF5946)
VEERVCPGCGLRLPVGGWEPDEPRTSSPECRQLLGEVTGFELTSIQLVRDLHQLTVDAYGAQHADAEGRLLRVPYSLVGLHLALDRGRSGLEVRRAHQRMGRPDSSWPAFPRPASTGTLTVFDVASAGLMLGSVEGHAKATHRWAADVWAAWSDHHTAVARLTDRLPV